MEIGSIAACSLPLQRHRHPPAAAAIAVLTQTNTLPDTQAKLAIADGDIQAAAQQAGLQVRRHIVRALVLMREGFSRQAA